MKNEMLAFDWAQKAVGILNIETDEYIFYRGKKEVEFGIKRLASLNNTIVSFNGESADLEQLAKIIGLDKKSDLNLKSKHDDMLTIISTIRWPPDPGTKPIRGQSLHDTFNYYFNNYKFNPPSHLDDDYIINNWEDCHMTSELWKKWQTGGILE